MIRDTHYHKVGNWPGGVGHGGTQLIQQYLREKYWIIGRHLWQQAFVAALRRMISRRGMVSEIISDNGTNFVGGNNFLSSIFLNLEENAQHIENQCKMKWTFTNWIFTTPRRNI